MTALNNQSDTAIVDECELDVVYELGLQVRRIGFQLCHGNGKTTDASLKNADYRPLEAASSRNCTHSERSCLRVSRGLLVVTLSSACLFDCAEQEGRDQDQQDGRGDADERQVAVFEEDEN